MIQAQNNSYWSEGAHTLRFVINNAGSGHDKGPISFQVVTKGPLWRFQDNLVLEDLADIQKFNIEYRVANVDGNFTLELSNGTEVKAEVSGTGNHETGRLSDLTPDNYAFGDTLLRITVTENTMISRNRRPVTASFQGTQLPPYLSRPVWLVLWTTKRTVRTRLLEI